jgi:hypothetical protein
MNDPDRDRDETMPINWGAFSQTISFPQTVYTNESQQLDETMPINWGAFSQTISFPQTVYTNESQQLLQTQIGNQDAHELNVPGGGFYGSGTPIAQRASEWTQDQRDSGEVFLEPIRYGPTMFPHDIGQVHVSHQVNCKRGPK